MSAVFGKVYPDIVLKNKFVLHQQGAQFFFKILNLFGAVLIVETECFRNKSFVHLGPVCDVFSSKFCVWQNIAAAVKCAKRRASYGNIFNGAFFPGDAYIIAHLKWLVEYNNKA